MFIMQFIKMHFLIQAIADVERSYDGIGNGDCNAFERQHMKNS
jgi:type I site-specific restriction-modification system R (restriction) subunit